MDPVAQPNAATPPAGRCRELAPLALYAAIPVCLFLPITLAGNLVFGSSDLYFHLLNRLYPAKWVLERGLLPLWNPFVNSGMPFVGDMQSVMFSPFAPLYYLFPVHWALFLASGVVLALMVFCGHPQFVLYTVTGFGVYVPWRGWQLRLSPRWLLAMFAVLGAVGLGLAALQLLPSWEFRHWSNRGGGLPYDVVARDSLPWQNLLMFGMPYFFGCPGTNALWQIMDYADTNVYFGVVSLVLAFLAVACLRREARLTWLFAGLWLFFLAMALGSHLPLYRWLAGDGHERSGAASWGGGDESS